MDIRKDGLITLWLMTNWYEAIADHKHEQHQELRDWLGYDFDSLTFSIDSVNQMLLPARRRGKAARN